MLKFGELPVREYVRFGSTREHIFYTFVTKGIVTLLKCEQGATFGSGVTH